SKFVAVGLSHKTAPLEIREKVFIPESSVGQCLRRLVDREVIEAGVLLSTCNRTELYAMARGEDAPDHVLQSFGWWPHELPLDTWRRYAYGLTDDEAIVHLLRVAGGLESMILGEAQVLGQLKEALAQARREGRVDPRLQIIVQGALRAGTTLEFDHIDDVIERIDIIISSTSAAEHVFDATRIQHLQAHRHLRPLLIIDLAVPRDVDPGVDQVPGVHLFNIDDLQSVATINLEERKASTPAAEWIVAQELARIRRALEARGSAPAVE